MAPSIPQIVCIVLIFISWIVMMAGVAAYHDESNLDSKDMRPYWWGVWFEFFLLVLNVVAMVMGADQWYVVLVFFASMASAYLMQHAEVWLRTEDNSSGDLSDAAACAAAGTIMVIISNWILIILLGNSQFRGQAAGKVCYIVLIFGPRGYAENRTRIDPIGQKAIFCFC